MHKKHERELDLIAMVQRARSSYDAAAKPSHISGVYWLEAKPHKPTQRPTVRVGAWMLQVSSAEVDAVWEKLKAATQRGDLGYKTKVCTSAPPGLAAEARLVYVCTYDADDRHDVQRVREALRQLGFEGEWHYRLLR